ncbi:MAG: ATP-dependent DNA helicase [Polyangiales bacterium]
MNFTDAQQEAIAYRGGHLQILACAGSGKTEVVARRIADLMNPARPEPLEPRNIVAFTFTERGAAELKARIVRRVRETHGAVHGLAEMFVGTIHAFCGRLLQDEVPEFLRFEVLDESSQLMLVLREREASGFAVARTADGAPLEAPADVRRYLSALDVLRQAELDHGELGNLPIAEALDRYRALLRRESFLDYTGQLESALDVLRRNIDAGQRLSARVKHVVVDEYQDTNALQEEVVRALADFGATLTVVGDDDQTIFQWNGADVQNILGFAERYPDVRQVRLEENFRSSSPIVSFARDFVARLERRLPKAMKPTDAQPFVPGDVAALSFGSEWDEARFIARKIKELYGLAITEAGRTRALTWSDIAILFRGNIRWAGRAILRVLDEHEIPYVVTGVKTLFDRSEVRAATGIFAFLRGDDHLTAPDLRDLWQRAELGLSVDAIDRMVALLEAHRRALTASADDDRARWSEYGLQRLYLAALDAVGLRERDVPKGYGEEVFFNLGRFSDVLGDFEALHAQAPPRARVAAFHEYATTAALGEHEEGMLSSEFAHVDAVRITTVHRAKGLQWPAVFLPVLGEDRFPMAARETALWKLVPRAAVRAPERYESNEDDERRLFYVAVTRAQRYLFASWAKGRNGKPSRPGAWFEELAAYEGVVTRDVSLRARPRGRPEARPGTSELRLTFSTLKPMLECAYRFKLQGVFGFRAPLAEAQGLGKCLHDALAEVHRRASEGDVIGPELVPRLLLRHLHLPFASPDTVARMREVARAILTRYLTRNAERLARVTLVEKPIEVVLDDDVIVHGRIDLVVRGDDDSISVVDLKSNHRAQAEELTETQLRLYALGYEALTGALPERTEIWELDALTEHVAAVDGDVAGATRALVKDVARRIRGSDYAPNPEASRCATCSVRGLCAAREAPITEVRRELPEDL